MSKRLWFFLTCLFVSASMTFAQRTVTGTVYDADNGEPVIGATVMVVGSTVGAPTDVNGKFTIVNVPNDAKMLRVSYIGMLVKEVAIKDGSNLKIFMESEVNEIQEVFVSAYGTATRETFTGSAAVIKSEKIENRQASNLTNILSGAVAGVQTLSNNGQPGTGSTVLIRGVGTINASATPLYVVDGVPLDGDINAIPMQDIESMTVLKDAAAGALYGARGANGVILVTTKKGTRNGEATITVDAKWGANSRQVSNYNVLSSSAEYLERAYQALYNSSYYNSGNGAATAHAYANEQIPVTLGYNIYTVPTGEDLIGVDGKINPNATLGYTDGKNYFVPDDWSDGIMRNGLRSEYNVGVSGGDERFIYYGSFNYLKDEGVIKNSAFERFSARLNVEYRAKDWLKLGANIAYANTVSNYPDEQTNTTSSGNAFYVANQIAPVYPFYVRDVNGNIMYDANNGNPIYDYGDAVYTAYSRNFMSISHPLSDLTYSTEDYLVDNLNSKFFAEVTPIKGLKITGTLGLHLDNTRYHYVSSSKYGQSKSYGGSAAQSNDHISGFSQQYLANYKRSFGNHNTDFLFGIESYKYWSETATAQGQNLYKEGDWTVYNTIDQRLGSGSAGEWALNSVFGRINYDFANKYFASFSLRRDGSSRFSKDNRWGTFWGASAAWEMAKESFIKDNASWINLLKFKVSYGQQGNHGVGNNYAYLDQYTMTGANGVFSDGTLAYKGNPDITWETAHTFNTGFDFSFWNSKLIGSIEYFSRQTSDMLYYKQVASSNGYTSIPVNFGKLRNYGLEIDLTYNILNKNGLKWDINANATFQKNKVVELHPDLNGEYINGTTYYKEGDSRYRLYLVKYAGVDPTTGQALYWAKGDMKDVYGNPVYVYDANGNLQYQKNDDGSYKYEDGHEGDDAYRIPEVEQGEYVTTNWATANSTNKQATRDMLPDVYGGFGTTFAWKGFDFGIQFAYQLGGLIYDSGYQTLMHGYTTSSAGRNWHEDIRKAWTPENTNTDVPRLDRTDSYTSSTSDRFLISSNYLAINNITFGYTLPKSITRPAGIESVRVFFAADNVALFSARKGLDPRQSFTSATTARYTALRSISGGIKVVF
jgi:TonB-linked SusC/RagA family outer membrane protein